MPARSFGRSFGALAGLLAGVVAVPLVLTGVAQARFGHVSPLHGMDPPWRWTLHSAGSWVRRVTGQLDTSSELIDLFLRVGLVVAWLSVAVLSWTIVTEVVFQLRHGMPSGRRRGMLGIGTCGRVIASGLIGLFAVATPAPALAAPSSRPAATVVARSGALPTPRREPSTAVAWAMPKSDAPTWSTYEVGRGESVWSIAERLAEGGDTAAMAQRITDANLGATMTDGGRFVTPALIEPGWVLSVPAYVPALAAPAAPGGASAAVEAAHHVVDGDSYWRIASDQLDVELGHPAPAVDVLTYTEDLIVTNAPRLGHRDPTMLHPGEDVVLATPAHPLSPPAVDAPPASDAPAPAPVAEPAPDVVTPAPAAAEPRPARPARPVVPAATAPTPPLVRPAPAPPAPAPLDESWRDAPPSWRDLPAGTSLGAVAGSVDEGSSSGVLAGWSIGAGLLFSVGALGALHARRRQQLRSARIGARLAAPTPRSVDLERRLRALSQPDLISRVDLALRAAALEIADGGGRVLVVTATPAGDVTLTVDRTIVPTGDVWQVDLSDGAWTLPARVPTEALAAQARRAGQPCPALVHLGDADGARVLVDLEALGLLAIDAPQAAAADVVRAIAASLAVSPSPSRRTCSRSGSTAPACRALPARRRTPSMPHSTPPPTRWAAPRRSLATRPRSLYELGATAAKRGIRRSSSPMCRMSSRAWPPTSSRSPSAAVAAWRWLSPPASTVRATCCAPMAVCSCLIRSGSCCSRAAWAPPRRQR